MSDSASMVVVDIVSIIGIKQVICVAINGVSVPILSIPSRLNRVKDQIRLAFLENQQPQSVLYNQTISSADSRGARGCSVRRNIEANCQSRKGLVIYDFVVSDNARNSLIVFPPASF